MNERMDVNFDHLPPELKKYINSYLRPIDLLAVARVNKEQAFSNADHWTKKFKEHFPFLLKKVSRKKSIDWFYEFKDAFITVLISII
jgi:hypothetical protein